MTKYRIVKSDENLQYVIQIKRSWIASIFLGKYYTMKRKFDTIEMCMNAIAYIQDNDKNYKIEI